MSVWEAVVLGIVQGLTEFLPVSSSGHLVLFGQLFGLREPNLTFDVMVHLGTLIAVAAALRQEIGLLFAGLQPVGEGPNAERTKAGRRLIFLLMIGTLPAGLAGLLAQDFIEQLFSSVTVVGAALLVTGGLLWWAEGRIEGGRTVDRMRPRDAFYIGVWQVLALVPGISRSGTTISAGLSRELTREDAARFSFLLSVPVIAGAVVLQAGDLLDAWSQGAWGPILIGTAAAALSGFAAIQGLLSLVKRYSLRVFSYYTWAVGLLVLILTHILHQK
ncbi:MAG: undecaprenyl-diphosphate phosphatase [Firmicutes bacterium]|jgi:undecaprenyl-diphosphatase|nr:undecaprenyl-diphosphate phosphatase [Bacillota bacterium]